MNASTRPILLVEDNKDDEELTLLAFSKSNIPPDVSVTRNGEAALDFLFGTGKYAGRDVSHLPRVVLLDLNLPKMSGLDVLRKVRADERTRFLPIVILSSSKEDVDIARSYSLGANAYVRKPVDYPQFTEAVKVLGAFWSRLNEPPPRHSHSEGAW